MLEVKRLLGVLAVATIAAGSAATPADAHAARGHRTALRVVIHKCVHGTAVAPKVYVLACGDGNSGLEKLHWMHWGATTASATGLGFVNNCVPSCVGGRFITWSVKVIASRRSRGAYHLLVITATGTRPKGQSRVIRVAIGRLGPETGLITT